MCELVNGEKMRYLVLLFIFAGCATFKSHDDYYNHIKQEYKQKKYSSTKYHILTFESKFPKSKKLCELWGLQIKVYKIKELEDDNYLKQLKDRRSTRCKNFAN
jgi:hypothetical protein